MSRDGDNRETAWRNAAERDPEPWAYLGKLWDAERQHRALREGVMETSSRGLGSKSCRNRYLVRQSGFTHPRALPSLAYSIGESCSHRGSLVAAKLSWTRPSRYLSGFLLDHFPDFDTVNPDGTLACQVMKVDS